MSENIEFKARVLDYEQMKSAMHVITGAEPAVLEQTDVYYRVKRGRAKLRSYNAKNELIIYRRSDILGPKSSRYIRIKVRHVNLVNGIMSFFFGIRGIVKKRRLLFLQNNIRFHLDQVQDLGDFMEIEYIVTPDEAKADIQIKVEDLLARLNIRQELLVEKSYIDLLTSKASD